MKYTTEYCRYINTRAAAPLAGRGNCRRRCRPCRDDGIFISLERDSTNTLPNLSALVREACNVTCLERSKQFGKKDCTLFRLNDCLATWRELHRPVYAARNVRSSEHVCCICQRIVAEWLSSCIYQFNVLCFTPLQYHKCLQYKIWYAVRVVTPARCSDVLFVRLMNARRNWACGTAIPLILTV